MNNAFIFEDLSRICGVCGEAGHPEAHCATDPVYVTVEAEEEASSVEFLCSYDNWQYAHAMQRTAKPGRFELTTVLPLGYFEFKFWVSKSYWKCSDDYPKTASCLTQNNYVNVLPTVREDFIHRGLGQLYFISPGRGEPGRKDVEVFVFLSCFALNSMLREHCVEPGAQIEVWGSWNGWSHGTRMASEKGSAVLVVRAAKHLHPWCYHYKFMLGGKWALDPYRRAVNANGCLNHVLSLEEGPGEPLLDSGRPPVLELGGPALVSGMYIYGHRMCAIGGKVYVLGGRIRDTAINTMHVYDPRAQTVEELVMSDPNGPPPLAFHRMVAHGDKLLVIGGSDQGCETMYSYSTGRRSWYRHVLHDCPLEKEGYSAALKHGTARVYFFGGYACAEEPGTDTHFSDLHVYYINLNRFSRLRAADRSGPCGRCSHSADFIGWRMHVFGGFRAEALQKRLFNELWTVDLFDHESIRWRRVVCEGQCPCPRYGHASAVVGLELFVCGGVGQDASGDFFLGDLWVFNAAQRLWRQIVLGAGLKAQRAYADMCAFDTSLLIYGGRFGAKADAEEADKFVRITFAEVISD